MHRPERIILAHSFGLLVGVLGLLPVALPAADTAPLPSPAEASPQRLRDVFGGRPLSGLADLKAMQNHLGGLTDQLKKCTVGVQVGPAWGSGVIVSKDGYVLTAAHVAGDPNKICKVRLADGREVNGTTLGLYKKLDAGLMKITDVGDWPFAEIADSRKLAYGQWCVALGHPGGYQDERGIVLRLGQILGMSDDAITTNCTLVGGDSGGPLFDMDGRVIGINSRISEQLTNNMHVPVSAFREGGAWDRLMKGEVWGRLPGQAQLVNPGPWLGVSGDDQVSATPTVKGARITLVKEKSPAAKYGLQVGDVIVRFDNFEIDNFEALTRAVNDCRPNESVMLGVRRGNEDVKIRVRLGTKPEK